MPEAAVLVAFRSWNGWPKICEQQSINEEVAVDIGNVVRECDISCL